MVSFIYQNLRPNNYESIENDIKTMYKDIFDKFPNSDTTFTWTGEKWEIGSGIDMAYFTSHESGNDSEWQFQE